MTYGEQAMRTAAKRTTGKSVEPTGWFPRRPMLQEEAAI